MHSKVCSVAIPQRLERRLMLVALKMFESGDILGPTLDLALGRLVTAWIDENGLKAEEPDRVNMTKVKQTIREWNELDSVQKEARVSRARWLRGRKAKEA